MPDSKPNNRAECAAAEDSMMLALQALGWLLDAPDRADRFLALTGLDATGLRERITDPALHSAIFAFLAQHEPDLCACAAAIGHPPARLMAAARTTEEPA